MAISDQQTSEAAELGQFVESYARANNLDPAEKFQLLERTRDTLDWLKLLRRTVGYTRTYSQNHPSAQRAVEEFFQRTTQSLNRYGAISLRIGPSEASSDEGFSLRNRAANESYALFCLFRDGVVRLQVRPGVTPDELASLLEIVAQNGRREGDDSVTWLWSGRHPHLRFEVEPRYSPRISAALLTHDPEDRVLAAYLGVLIAAGPRFQGADPRPEISRAHVDSLGHHGVQPEVVRNAFTGGPLGDRFAPPTDRARTTFVRAFGDDVDRRHRVNLIRRRFGVRQGG